MPTRVQQLPVLIKIYFTFSLSLDLSNPGTSDRETAGACTEGSPVARRTSTAPNLRNGWHLYGPANASLVALCKESC